MSRVCWGCRQTLPDDSFHRNRQRSTGRSGLCRPCTTSYHRRRREQALVSPSPEEIAAFWDRVEKSDGCWEWMGSRTPHGYGFTKGMHAHRMAYRIAIGPIPVGMHIDHLCRNRACVNPEHLEAVTQAENIRRGAGPTALNQRKTHCKRGHPLSGTNLVVRRSGYRECRICDRARSRPARGHRRPEHWRAWNAVQRAVATGRLSRPDRCDDCGAGAALKAHHHRGYDPENALDVVWLCPRCHAARHAKREVA